jgi:hypothetical protein
MNGMYDYWKLKYKVNFRERPTYCVTKGPEALEQLSYRAPVNPVLFRA